METQPGDIVAFDEHLIHGSHGGGHRRQWRVDFIADPRTNREEDLVRRSFAQIFDLKWDGGYDVDRYPSFGDWWQRTHPEWSTRASTIWESSKWREPRRRSCANDATRQAPSALSTGATPLHSCLLADTTLDASFGVVAFAALAFGGTG